MIEISVKLQAAMFLAAMILSMLALIREERKTKISSGLILDWVCWQMRNEISVGEDLTDDIDMSKRRDERVKLDESANGCPLSEEVYGCNETSGTFKGKA